MRMRTRLREFGANLESIGLVMQPSLEDAISKVAQ